MHELAFRVDAEAGWPITLITSSRDAGHGILHAGQLEIEHRRMENAMGESFRGPTD